jgi:transcriptional regulator with XRE-family HTH domain
MDLSECNDYNPPMLTLAVWQLRIAQLVGDEHGRRKAVAKAAKMSPSQFGDLINVPGKNPEIRQLQRIATALGVDLADLFRSPEATAEESHDDSRRSVSASTTIVLEHLGPTLRAAFVQLLMGHPRRTWATG